MPCTREILQLKLLRHAAECESLMGSRLLEPDFLLGVSYLCDLITQCAKQATSES